MAAESIIKRNDRNAAVVALKAAGQSSGLEQTVNNVHEYLPVYNDTSLALLLDTV